MSVTRIDIAICTYQRAQVVDTLRSVAGLTVPDGYTLHVIVADNDVEPTAQVTVQSACDTLGLNLTYVHAPARNISIARNACLDAAGGEYLAFIDDDQLLKPDWLSIILTRAHETKADIVLSPVRGLFPDDSPLWMMAGGFHDNMPVYVRGKIITGYTGGNLIRLTSPAIAGLRFDLSYGVSGGEDTDYTTRAHARGAHIDFAADAGVYEPVPANRRKLSWLITRRARYGETHAQQLIALGKPKTINAVLAAIKAAACFVMVPLTILHPVRWRQWLLRGVLHVAVARRLLFGLDIPNTLQ